jgi:protein involved in polysaccharide export with SLBB domain
MIMAGPKWTNWSFMALAMALCFTGCHTPRHAKVQSSHSSFIEAGDVLDLRMKVPDVEQSLLPQTCRVRVGRDGTVFLPAGVVLRAQGKTPASFAKDLRAAYVPKVFLSLEVRVENMSDFGPCRVIGEVRQPGEVFWIGQGATVLRVIDMAGGFTELADRKHIELRRRNGEVVKVDWDKARKRPKLDPEVSIGDRVVVLVPRKKLQP